MANITLSQSFLDTDLSSLGSTSTILENIEGLSSVAESFLGEVEFLNEPKVSGNNLMQVNPSFISDLGSTTFLGKMSVITDNYGNPKSGTFAFDGYTVETNDGKFKVKMSLNGSADSSKLSMNIKFNQLSFA